MSTRNTLGTGQNNSTYMNSKNKGIIMLLVAAVIVGIIGGVALITYMKPQKTTVYTFKDNYNRSIYDYIWSCCEICQNKI